MFAGIIEEQATIVRVERRSESVYISIRSALDHRSTKIGDSIAIDGVCLTLTDHEADILTFEAGPETQRRTTLGIKAAGQRVNLERSLDLAHRLHGHFVSGHVDGTVKLLERKSEGENARLLWELPADLRRFIAPKGSVTLNGVSLTVGETGPEDFAVYLIKHTLEQTTFFQYQPGAEANIEIDLLARYVERLLGGEGRTK